MRVKCHPTLGILVCTDGHVMVPANRSHKAHWTFGCKDGRGYLCVMVNRKLYQVHRLVAGTFLPNPKNKPQIDHINRNKTDNRVQNLRWATPSDNQRNTKQHDRVDARGGTHLYEDYKKFVKEKNDLFRKKHKYIHFSDGKYHWLPNSEAIELLKLPVKDRVWKE